MTSSTVDITKKNLTTYSILGFFIIPVSFSQLYVPKILFQLYIQMYFLRVFSPAGF